MGRRKTNRVYNYFQLGDSNENTAKCLLCEKIIKSQHGTNLLHHLKVHPSIYQLVVEKNKENLLASSTKKTQKVNENNTTSTILEECVNLTTIHGRPFTLIDDKAFQNIINLIPGQQQQAVNSRNVKMCISKRAISLRHEICSEFKNKLVSLKVDAATLGTRCFLGINIQYTLEDKIVVRNLSVMELYARHTGDYLAQNVLSTLYRYQICIDQIFCCTTDNGANMLKMTKILQNNLNQSSGTDRVEQNSLSDSDMSSSVNIINTDDDISDTESESTESDDRIDPESFQDNLNSGLTSSFHNDSIISVRCSAHTLQLAIRDACDNSETQDLIILVRSFVKKLRTQNYAMYLKASGKKKPILDCPTRWGSTFDMLERFLDLKEVITTESNELFFPPEKWSLVENVIASLKPAKILTKMLQTEQLTIGDFYGNWLKCQLESTEINTDLSRRIVDKMSERQKLLFNNRAFVSAIYLDPRFNATLTLEDQTIARDHLLKTFQRMIELERRNLEIDKSTDAVPSNLNDVSNTPHSVADADSMTTEDKLRNFITHKYLLSHDQNVSTTNTTTISQIETLKILLISFLDEPLLDHSTNIFRYWQTKKSSSPLLYQLAQIVLSAPATQVSVERLFSTLKFVVSHLRMSLKDDLVDDILFIRNNSVTK